MADVTVVIPAYDEAARIGHVVAPLVEDYAVLVVDDGSTDDTADEARSAGADVLTSRENRGYIQALKRGFRAARTDVVVTLDADGEHRPADVERLVTPVRDDEYDLVLGAREHVPRPSERVLNRLARRRVDVTDTGTGFRALRRSLATDLDLETACPCGTFALEAAAKGARIGEVAVETQAIEKPRGVAWQHGRQLYHVLRHLV
ncbi:glycosyltransferase family 2 protein [Halobacteriales archaeon Cl-PHB]